MRLRTATPLLLVIAAGGCTELFFDPSDPATQDPPAPSLAGACTAAGGSLCDALPPACPASTVPGIANGCWTGYCIPADVCEGLRLADPGLCEQGRCDDLPPACPVDTIAGVDASGCYTGFCIPTGRCVPVSPP